MSMSSIEKSLYFLIFYTYHLIQNSKWAEANGNTDKIEYLNGCFKNSSSQSASNKLVFVKEYTYSCFVKPGCLVDSNDLDSETIDTDYSDTLSGDQRGKHNKCVI